VKKAERNFFSKERNGFLALVIGAASFLLYSNTIPNGYNIDDELITENHILSEGSNFATFQKIFTEPYYKDKVGNQYEYRPMVLVFYFFEFMLLGRNPHVSHFFNVLLFSVTCVLLFFLLLRLFADVFHAEAKQSHSGRKVQPGSITAAWGLSSNRLLAFAITVLFAVHPLHTEVVASIKNRDELLALLFGLLSWFFALRFVDSRKITFYLLYLLFFVAGLFSKQTGITFALLIPVSIIMFRQISLQTLVTLILPVQLISAIFSPVYLIYKKAALFIAQLFFLFVFYYFLSRRNELTEFLVRIYRKISGFFLKVWMLIKRFIGSYSIRVSEGFIHFKANYKVLLGTVLVLAVLAGTIGVLTKKKEEVKKVQWNIKDTFHDFRELRVVPAMETPAPAVIPIAGRKLNFVELPLLYEERTSVKAATSLLVLGKYFKLMFTPYPLRFYYGYGLIPMTDFKNIFASFSIIIYLSLVIMVVYFLIVRRHFIAAFGIIFYLVSILPLSNLLTPIAGIMAERLAYPASLGFCIAFSYALLYPVMFPDAALFGIKMSGFRRASPIVMLLILLVYAGMTFSRNFLWKDHITLMRHDIKHMRKSARGHHLLASHLAVAASQMKQKNPAEGKKMMQEAIVHFKQTLDIYPEFPKGWYDLAKAYMVMEDYKNALDSYARSTQTDSDYAPSFFELGLVHAQLGKKKEAEEAYRQAIARDSLFKEAYINLSYSYYQDGKYQDAIEVNMTALRHLPNAYELYVNTGRTYLMIQDTPTALSYLEKAVALNRSDKAMIGMMADLFANIGNYEKAEYYRKLR